MESNTTTCRAYKKQSEQFSSEPQAQVYIQALKGYNTFAQTNKEGPQIHVDKIRRITHIMIPQAIEFKGVAKLGKSVIMIKKCTPEEYLDGDLVLKSSKSRWKTRKEVVCC